ncbi:hypothetical protein GCM10028818_41150 [Spirosoma horti]
MSDTTSTHKQVSFKFELNAKVYWQNEQRSVIGYIKRRGYQETWHNDLDDVGGYITNIFYEVVSFSCKAIFNETEFGVKVFTDAVEFLDATAK